MSLATKPWDVVAHLDSDEAVAAYVEAALEDGDPGLVAAALSDVVTARGIARVAESAGVSHESLEALVSDRRADLGTVLRVMRALGLRLTAQPAR
jgi:probable addiction module antidote protein